jgi:hypothetical protein
VILISTTVWTKKQATKDKTCGEHLIRPEGVDMTDDRATQAFIADYNHWLSYKNQPDNNADTVNLLPTLPIVEHWPKVGCTQPCPCGSGKTYEKGCGSAENVNLRYLENINSLQSIIPEETENSRKNH